MKASRLLSFAFAAAVLASACAAPTPNPANAPAATSQPAQPAASDTTAEATMPAATSSETATEAPAASGEKVKVTWWTETAVGDYQDRLTENFVKTFNDAHPNIELELKYTDQLDEVLRTAVQAGAGPDILQTPGPAFVSEYIAAGFIAPLDDYVTKYGWDAKIFPWAIEAGKLDGKLYSLPLTYETLVMWYNKDTLAKNNWTVPTTRAELEKIAEEAKSKSIYPFVNGNAGWRGVNEWLVTLWWGNYAGADTVYKALKQEIKWDDPLLVDSITLLNDYMQKGYFRGSKENYFATDFPEVDADSASGKGVFDFAGTWAFQYKSSTFPDNPEAWDWAPMPQLRDGVTPTYPLSVGSSLSINSKSKNPDAAAEVLAWVYGDAKRAAKIIHDYPGEWVVPIQFKKDDFPADTDARFIRILEAMSTASTNGNYGYTTWTFWPKKSDQYIVEQMDNVFTSKMTPAEFSAGLQDTYAAEAKDNQLPPIPSR